MPRIGWAKRPALTLIELVVVVGLIGLLVGLLLPGVQAARNSSQRVSCLNNLRQIGVALQNYHARQQSLPPRRKLPDGVLQRFDDATPDHWLSWMALILPDIEQGPLWQQTLNAFRAINNPYFDPPHVGNTTPVRLYVCPADGREMNVAVAEVGVPQIAVTSFLGVAGGYTWDGVLGIPGRSGIRLTDISDGTSNTVMLGERPPPDSGQAGNWYRNQVNAVDGPDCGWLVVGLQFPTDPCLGPYEYGPGHTYNPCDRFHYWSLHQGGSNWLYADGSVRFLAYSAKPILPALATRAGGEVVTIP